VLPHIIFGQATFPFQVAKNPKATWRVRGGRQLGEGRQLGGVSNLEG